MNIHSSYPKPPNLTIQVYAELKQAILSGEYKNGDALTEVGLAQSMNVSRTPVREALRLLEQENLVLIRQNRGAVVIGISREDIRDIYSIRSELEGLAAQRVAERSTDEEIASLGVLVDRMDALLDDFDAGLMLEADDAFHQRLYELSGSRMLGFVLSEMHVYASRVRKVSMAREGRAAHTVEEHRAIFKAISEHNPEKARRCASRHIEQTIENISDLISENKE